LGIWKEKGRGGVNFEFQLGYVIPYKADHRKLLKVGVEFSLIEGEIKRWLIE